MTKCLILHFMKYGTQLDKKPALLCFVVFCCYLKCSKILEGIITKQHVHKSTHFFLK